LRTPHRTYCLVVAVSHPQDPADKECIPVKYRHWAQRNLIRTASTQGAPVLIPFKAANPSIATTTFDLRVGPVLGQRARLVADESQTRPSDIAVRVRLLDEQGAPVSQEGERTHMTMEHGPLEERPFQIMAEVDNDVPAGHSAALEVGLFEQGDNDSPVGSLGVVLLPPGAL
jgi:hypothetical protein